LIRPDFESLQLSEWTDDEVFVHLKKTFDLAVGAHQDVMEPYVTMLVETEDRDAQLSIMRTGLRSTINQRYPIAR